MKKQFFILAGTLIVVLLLAVWGYLFFFGTPESTDDVFADLGFGGEVDTSYVPPVVEEVPAEPVVNMERAQLRQLTTKPIAGFREVLRSTTTPAVLYYVEQGTGHVYTIDTQTGEEVRISGTTVAQAEKALISSDGSIVAISSFSNTKTKPLFIGSFGTTSTNLTEVTRESTLDFGVVDGAVLYTTPTGRGLTVSSLSVPQATETNLLSLPFAEAKLLWGSSVAGPHYVYPKATYALEGYLYEINDGSFTRLPVSGFGLTAKANDDMVLFTRSEKQQTKSYIFDRNLKTTEMLDAVVLPEKCLLGTAGLEFVCPFESIQIPYEFPDNWYKGLLSFKDSLWLLDASSMSGEMLVDTFTESGREIDIINLQPSTQGNVLYFINKNDNTLWMYEI